MKFMVGKMTMGQAFVIINIKICIPQINPPVQSSDLKIMLF